MSSFNKPTTLKNILVSSCTGLTLLMAMDAVAADKSTNANTVSEMTMEIEAL